MDLYRSTFAILAFASCGLSWVHYKHDSKRPATSKNTDAKSRKVLEDHGDPIRFRRIFLPVYFLVMASDWLQVAPYFKYRVSLAYNINIFLSYFNTIFIDPYR